MSINGGFKWLGMWRWVCMFYSSGGVPTVVIDSPIGGVCSRLHRLRVNPCWDFGFAMIESWNETKRHCSLHLHAGQWRKIVRLWSVPT